MSRLALAVLLALLAFPSRAEAVRLAVGVEPGASLRAVAARVARVTGGTTSMRLAPLKALVLDAPSARGVATVEGVSYVEDLRPTRRVAFVPNDPLAPRQWYLAEIRAFDAWPLAPVLPETTVAVIDSGVDEDHPQLQSRIADVQSFVGGSVRDRLGHGTFVAGQIAAQLNDRQGIAGIAFSARLLVAKVVRADGTISVEAEARAIRWAVDRGADVINLSLGGLRDPASPARDSYSPLEASAIEYAVSRGALVVAAVGNGDQAPRTPWKFASYPAALPHVIGVSAFRRDGSVPDFSNRDAVYNDIAAPGDEILSTLPRAVTARFPTCLEQGYSSCGSIRYRRAEGTSFAAPQVSAAAAQLLAVRPSLTADQVRFLLERSAEDARTTNGCRGCRVLRDALTGWGRLDVTSSVVHALKGAMPAPDVYEPNDEAGARAATIPLRRREVAATIDFWDDQTDVYRVRLRRGQRLFAALRGPAGQDTSVLLWRPGTRRVGGFSARGRLAQSRQVRGVERIRGYRARARGWYYLQVKISTPGSGRYTLSLARR